MKQVIFNKKIEENSRVLAFFHWLNFLLVFFALSAEIVMEKLEAREGIIEIAFLMLLYRFYFQTVKKLYYSFWTFSFFLFLYLLWAIVQSSLIYSSLGLSVTYAFALLIFFAEVYFLSSPIYFPKVSWWEYDFRYRDDLKIQVSLKPDVDAGWGLGESSLQLYDGRMTDLRRQAGCLVLFQDFSVDTHLLIRLKDHLQEKESTLFHTFQAVVMTKRLSPEGRGITYGVSFLLDAAAKDNYKLLHKLWKAERKRKRKIKYKNIV